MDPNTQSNMSDTPNENQGYPQQTTQQEQLSQPERMTGNNPVEINPNEPRLKEYDDLDTRHQREIELPDREQEQKDGYAETPDKEYIPEINGNEKYQKNYQDDEKPAITE